MLCNVYFGTPAPHSCIIDVVLTSIQNGTLFPFWCTALNQIPMGVPFGTHPWYTVFNDTRTGLKDQRFSLETEMKENGRKKVEEQNRRGEERNRIEE